MFGIVVLMFSICTQSVYAADTNQYTELVTQFQHETHCKNISAVIFDRGEVSYYGDSQALYQIGSMTKAFTGLAVQKLICEGYIQENEDIAAYIPGFQAYCDDVPVTITVEELLEQTSGFTNSEKDYPSASEQMTLSEWADSISGSVLHCKPGTEYHYSNVNYNLLGLMIEKVSGMSYRNYMEQEILVPLGLQNTFVGQPDDARIVEGTRLCFRQVYDFSLNVREASIPAGYFYANAEDMARWIELWTGTIPVPSEMQEPMKQVKERLTSEGDYYSGWERFADGVTGHSGGTPNYSSRIVFSEAAQTGVCVLCNLNVAATTDSLCNNLFADLSGENSGRLAADIWTIFDRIFTAVSIGVVLLLAGNFRIRRKAILTAIVIILTALLALMLILFPILFGADLQSILLTWAPWSLGIGLLLITADILMITGKIILEKPSCKLLRDK
jgi:putative ATP-binding cassette transporter